MASLCYTNTFIGSGNSLLSLSKEVTVNLRLNYFNISSVVDILNIDYLEFLILLLKIAEFFSNTSVPISLWFLE